MEKMVTREKVQGLKHFYDMWMTLARPTDLQEWSLNTEQVLSPEH